MKFKNYYSILGLDMFESNPDAIKNAYRKATEEYHPKNYDGYNIKEKLTDINEAFLTLSNPSSKQLYDRVLTNQDRADIINLEKLISDSNDKASTFIESYFSTQKNNKKRSTVIAIIAALCIFAVFIQFIKGCAQSTYDNDSEVVTSMSEFSAPASWTQYTIDNSFSLSIPPSMELRSDFDTYTRFLESRNLSVCNADALFQQKDLANFSPDALETYCRIIASRAYVGAGEATRYNKSPKLDSVDYSQLRDIADAEIEQWTYVSTPSYKWININGTKAIDISYSRNGLKGPVICHIYLLANYDEVVKIVTAYRKIDEDKWQNEIDNVIKTFKWNKLK